MTREYRVVWQREGGAEQQSGVHLSRESADRHLTMLRLRGVGWPLLMEGRIESREVGEWEAT